MALRESDKLSEIIGTDIYSNRRDIWLWLYLQEFESANFSPDTCCGLTMRDMIAEFLARNNLSGEYVSHKIDRFMAPDYYISWITSDNRIFNWIHLEIQENNNKLISGYVRLTGRDLLIATIDIWNVDIIEKVALLDELKKTWIKHKKMDSQFNWFEDKDAGVKRCKFAWEWLLKNEPMIASRSIGSVTCHSDLLSLFDQDRQAYEARTLIVQKIQRAWHKQQNAHKNTASKQYNFMLPILIIAKLDLLAKEHKAKRADILEILIEQESEAGIYLSDRFKKEK